MITRLFPLSIRAQLILLAFILAFPAVSIIIYSGMQMRKEAINAARMETQRFADSIATGQQNLLAAAQQLIIALAQLSDVKKHDTAKVQPVLKEILALNAQYSNIFMADRSGLVWATAVPVKPPFIIADRRYFKNALTSGHLSSGEFVVSRATGKPSFNLAHPQKNERGAVRGTICVGFILDYYKQLLERSKLLPGTSYVLLDHAGAVLSGTAEQAQYLGKRIDAELFRRMREGPDADTFIGIGMDGKERIISYRRLNLPDEQTPYLYIRAGIPIAVVLAEANKTLRYNLALLTSFLAVAFIIAWLIGKRSIADRISLLEIASRRLASGDLQVRVSDLVSGGELGRLGQTFDTMASQLAAREQALRESEERFRSIFNGAMDGIVLTDTTTKTFITGNKTMCAMLGCTEDELRTMKADDIHPADAMPRVMKHLEETIRGEISVAQEMPVKRRDGSVFYADISATLLKLGERAHFIGVFRDVTERKRASEEQQKLVSIIETSDDLIGIADLDGRLLYLNAAGRKLVGLEGIEDVRNKPVSAFHLKTDYRKFESEILPSIMQTGSWRGETAYRHFKTGEPIPVEMYGFLIRDTKTGQPVALANISRDITERKRVEQALRESEEMLRAAVNVSQIGIFDHDQRTDTIYWSPQQRKIHGWGPDEPVSLQTFFDLIHPEDLERIAAAVRCAHDPAGDGIWDVEHRIIRRDGTIRWLKERSQTFFEGEGDARRPVRTVGAVLDITGHKLADEEKQKLQSQLLQAQKMEAIGQLAGGVAHDFNNILTAIIGYSSIVQMKMRADDPSRLYVDQILASAQRAAGLTQSLLAFSRKQVINPKNIDLNDSIRKVEKFLTRIIGEDITLTTQLSAETLTIFADNTQIEQVLMNLATNARDAMPKGGKLMIETGRAEFDGAQAITHSFGEPGAYAVLTVSDTGAGMDEQTREKIFDPFFTTKEVGRGTGLGLSIVYGIVKQNNGHINVYSEIGKGTTFKIYLPIIDSAVQDQDIRNTEVSAPLRGGTETILLAEDNESVRTLTQTVLSEYGYTVIEAADGEEALKKFTENMDGIRLMIIDVIMPGKNGREVYDEVKKMMPDIKVLFTSGYPADLIQKEGVLEKGLNFLSKPSSPQDILKKVREVLDQ